MYRRPSPIHPLSYSPAKAQGSKRWKLQIVLGSHAILSKFEHHLHDSAIILRCLVSIYSSLILTPLYARTQCTNHRIPLRPIGVRSALLGGS